MTRLERRSALRTLLLVPVCLGLMVSLCAARDQLEGFDSDQTSWKVIVEPSAIRVLSHRRHRYIYYAGTASENLEFETLPEAAALRLEHDLTPGRLLDELELALWLRSNRNGASLAVRVVFPYQQDQKSGGCLSIVLDGDAYTKIGAWQRLECRDLVKQLRQRLPQVRQRLQAELAPGQDIDLRGLYVDRAILHVRAGRGTTEMFIDDLQFGPLVDARNEQQIAQVQHEQPVLASEVEYRLDRLLFQNKPFFPRLVPYHGEPADQLANQHFNVVWIPDYQDQALLQDLQRVGLRAMATPPRVSSEGGTFLDESAASLAPFGPETAPILFWNLGTRIPPEAKPQLAAWAEQVRNADRRFKRPLLADVSGLERTYSRQLTMMGVSRHALHSSFGSKTYRDWLIERRQLAQPGSSLWTWVQTEPVQATAEARRAAHASPIVIEPEQIRLQVYAALAAGFRGIAYWTHSPLHTDRPGNRERELMIAQLNMELELLEPWLATGTLQYQAPFSAQVPTGAKIGQLALDFGKGISAARQRDALLKERENQLRRQERLPHELEAAVIRSDFGLLLLPVWYSDDAAFVPGQMAANDATIVVPGVDESASAWEVSTTGVRNVARKRVTGGIQITLPKFDMTSTVILSADRTLVDRLRMKMETLREPSARICLELARLKRDRVVDIDRQLNAAGVGQLDASRILLRVQSLLDQAQQALQQQDYHSSRMYSADAMQMLRLLQHAYWRDATRTLFAPVSSPHAVCFQTLPDHWRLVSEFGRSPTSAGENLLRSGDFEDFDTMLAEGWKHTQNSIDGVRAAAELYPRGRSGKYCLRLIAVPATGVDPPTAVQERPVTVTTPPVTVRKGQIVYLGGWVRVAAPSSGNLDGALCYDSIVGPTGALRFRTSSDWRHFEMLREVQETGEFTFNMTLTGFGEVHFDDLQIIPHDIDRGLAESLPSPSTGPPGPRANPLGFLKRLPGMQPRPARETP